MALDNDQFAITPIPDIVEHLHRRGRRLGGRDGGNNDEASGKEDRGPDIEHRSHCLAGKAEPVCTEPQVLPMDLGASAHPRRRPQKP
jgi:hypothetical protein